VQTWLYQGGLRDYLSQTLPVDPIIPLFEGEMYATEGETEKLFEDQLEKLRASLVSVDPTLGDALKGGREKILYQINNLRTRFIHNRTKRDETAGQQVDRLFAALYPNKGLQEREINVAYFLARYGYELIDRLYTEVEIGNNDHKLVYL